MEALCWTLVSCSCSETHCRKAHRGGPCCSRASRPCSPGGPPLPLHSGTADGGEDKGRVVGTAGPRAPLVFGCARQLQALVRRQRAKTAEGRDPECVVAQRQSRRVPPRACPRRRPSRSPVSHPWRRPLGILPCSRPIPRGLCGPANDPPRGLEPRKETAVRGRSCPRWERLRTWHQVRAEGRASDEPEAPSRGT